MSRELDTKHKIAPFVAVGSVIATIVIVWLVNRPDYATALWDFIFKFQTFITGIAALFVSIWAVWLVRATLLETRRLGSTQLRAYVRIDAHPPFAIIEGEIAPDGNKVIQGFGVSISVSNKGVTPAMNFKVEAFCSGTRHGAPVWEQQRCIVDQGDDFGELHDVMSCNFSIRPVPALQELTQSEREEVTANLRVEYRYDDVFKEHFKGTLWFTGQLNDGKPMSRIPRPV